MRSLNKRLAPCGLARLGLGKKELCGRATPRGVMVYRGGRGIATLLGTTLYGRFVTEGGREFLVLRPSRCRSVFILWALWCFLLFAAGLSLLFGTAFGAGITLSDLASGLVLLAVGCLALLPLFFYSKKETARLAALLAETAAFRAGK